MLTPPTYSDPSQSTDNDLLQMYNSLPPIRPDLFGALPQEAPQGGSPQAGGPPPPPGGEAPMDMNQYLIDKVMEIKQRMNRDGGNVGALSAFSNATMPSQPQGGPPQPQQSLPPPPQPMRA